MAPNWQIGDKIENRWEIHKILKGGMGIVYIGYDHKWDQPFAAKTFQDEVFAQDSAIADLFEREATTWIGLDRHENITRAEFVHKLRDKPLLFLEYISGGDLSSWIGTSRLLDDLPQVIRFAIQFCDGMIHAASKGIKVHRDIKPANCLVTKVGTLKVTDFGLVKIMDEVAAQSPLGPSSQEDASSQFVSRTGSRAGTPPYMAPEQFDDSKHVGVQADIYSFGVMLFEMLEGRRPFIARSAIEIEQLHKSESPPPLSHANSAMAGLVEQCLAKDPALRFPDFGVVRGSLANLFEKLTGRMAPQPAVGKELDGKELLTKGMSFASLGRMEAALASLDHALVLIPDDVDSWWCKGNVLGEMGRIQGEIECCDRAIEIDPNYAEAWSMKGAALLELSQYDEAVRCSDRALQIKPRLASAWQNRGGAQLGVNNVKEALSSFEQAYQFGDDPKAADGVAYCRRLLQQRDEGEQRDDLAQQQREITKDGEAEKWCEQALNSDDEERLACFDRALAIDPCHAKSLILKSALLREADRNEDAIAHCDRALALPPEKLNALDPVLVASIWRNKSLALHALGRLEEEVAFYDMILATNRFHNERMEVWGLKGAACLLSGRFAEALLCFEQGHEMGDARAEEGMIICREQLNQTRGHELDCAETSRPSGTGVRSRSTVGLMSTTARDASTIKDSR